MDEAPKESIKKETKDEEISKVEEIKELEVYLGMSESEANDTDWRGTNEGSKLAGYSELWDEGVLKNDSEFGISGFKAVPNGYRHHNNHQHPSSYF